MKRVSDGGEPIILVPPVLEPVEIEVALAIVLPKFRDIPVAIAILPDRSYRISSVPLPFEYSWGCILLGTSKVLQYTVPSSFVFEEIST